MNRFTATTFFIDGQGILRCEALAVYPWLEHGFETRSGKLPENGFQTASLRQVHSATVVVPGEHGGDCGEGDALVTAREGQLLVVRTADCVPVLLADPETRAVAAVHAGWRGVVQEVLPRAMDLLGSRFRARPASIRAAIGPCIRMDAFEVGPEVAVEFQLLFPEREDLHTRCHIDLAEGCVRQLLRAGLRPEHIFDSGHCSYASPDLYHSFRRERERAGRMHSFIGLRRAAPTG